MSLITDNYRASHSNCLCLDQKSGQLVHVYVHHVIWQPIFQINVVQNEMIIPLHRTCQDLIFSFCQHNAELKSMLSDQNHNDLVSTIAELPDSIMCVPSLLKAIKKLCAIIE